MAKSNCSVNNITVYLHYNASRHRLVSAQAAAAAPRAVGGSLALSPARRHCAPTSSRQPAPRPDAFHFYLFTSIN